MQEAKFSINFRYNFRGFDSQMTLRSDENCQDLINKSEQVIINLEKLGATPEKRWQSAKNGNGQQPSETEPEAELECPIHHKAARSKSGGLYCPSKLPDGSWCQWKSNP